MKKQKSTRPSITGNLILGARDNCSRAHCRKRVAMRLRRGDKPEQRYCITHAIQALKRWYKQEETIK